jgi:hypothetical protein
MLRRGQHEEAEGTKRQRNAGLLRAGKILSGQPSGIPAPVSNGNQEAHEVDKALEAASSQVG